MKKDYETFDKSKVKVDLNDFQRRTEEYLNDLNKKAQEYHNQQER